MSATDLEERAVQWLLRQERAGWDDADQAELEAWLNKATAHRVAYLRMTHGWRRVGRLASLRTPATALADRATPRVRPMAIAAGLLIVALLGAAGAAAVWRMSDERRSYATEIGGHAVVPLKDGSRLELNTDTRLRTAVTAEHRVVWLDKGEAYFDIAKDKGRPFVVYAGDRRIVVLGTKFTVRREGDSIRVAVVEGRVQVEAVKPKTPAPPAVINGGDTIVAEEGAMLVALKSERTVSSELAWRHGLLVFDRTTLEDAAAEFNRYNRKKLVIDDPDVAAIRIGGSFEPNNVDAFARLLQQAFGLRVSEDGDEILISS